MANGISVPFVADVRSFLKGTSDVEGALDDVIDSLDQVAQEGKTTERVISDSLGDIETEAKDASGTMEREFRDAFDTLKTESASASTKAKREIDDVPEGARKGKRRWGEIGQELGGELSQNIGEGVSSKALGADGAIDLVLGTAGGVLPALGPIAGAIGIGGLIVGSVVQGILKNQEEVTAAIKKTVKDAYDGAAEVLAGESKKVSISDVIKGFTPDEIQNFKDANVTVYEMADAIATYQNTGDRTKLDAITTAINDRAQAVNDAAKAQDSMFSDGSGPGIFDVRGPLIGDQGTLAAINSRTTAINQQADALRELQAGAAAVDLRKIRDINREMGRPVYGSPYARTRWVN